MSPLRTLTLSDFLAQVGAKSPAPGGGAVACTTGATAAAIAKMVVEYSIGKKNLADHQSVLSNASATLARFAAMFLELADEDAAAYALVNELSRLPESDPRRQREYAAAAEASVQAPRAALAAAADLLRLIETLVPITNRHLKSDLAIAAVLAEAAAKAAWWNVHVNLKPDQVAIASECRSQVDRAATQRASIERALMQT